MLTHRSAKKGWHGAGHCRPVVRAICLRCRVQTTHRISYIVGILCYPCFHQITTSFTPLAFIRDQLGPEVLRQHLSGPRHFQEFDLPGFLQRIESVDQRALAVTVYNQTRDNLIVKLWDRQAIIQTRCGEFKY